jgi:hypothetical protein
MTRVAPLDAEADDALFVCHRAGTLPGVSVRPATKVGKYGYKLFYLSRDETVIPSM